VGLFVSWFVGNRGLLAIGALLQRDSFEICVVPDPVDKLKRICSKVCSGDGTPVPGFLSGLEFPKHGGMGWFHNPTRASSVLREWVCTPVSDESFMHSRQAFFVI
jgi:hypothetical protein